MNPVLWFFDLYAQDRPTPESRTAASAEPSAKSKGRSKTATSPTDQEKPEPDQVQPPVDKTAEWRQLVVYVACALGIVLGPYMLDAAKGTYASFWTMFGSGYRLFWAVIFGFVVTAALFKTVLSASTPLVGQIGAALASGSVSGKIIPFALTALTKWAEMPPPS